MTALQIKIITKAVKIRIAAGENIDEILNSYTKLTDEEKQNIKDSLGEK